MGPDHPYAPIWQVARLRPSASPWQLPPDLSSFFQSEATCDALNTMVSGSIIHIQHEKDDNPSYSSSAGGSGAGEGHVVEGGERPSVIRLLAGLIEIVMSGRIGSFEKLRSRVVGTLSLERNHQVVSGPRFIQMSEDLTTLRWSW